MIPTLLGITLVVQLFIVITPGEPARMLARETKSRKQEVEQLRIDMGLNDPFLVRYGNYMKDLLLVTRHLVQDEERRFGRYARPLPFTLLLCYRQYGSRNPNRRSAWYLRRDTPILVEG
jgi:ABC-type dipeptide/oligopeptide/nickel transport system permease component